MNALVAVDPGVHECGAALFVDRELRQALLVPATDAPLRILQAGAVQCVCEKPQVYYGRGKGRAADLVDLSIAAGRMTALYPTQYVLPAQWKGQVPKDVHHARVRKALDRQEIITLDLALAPVPEGKRHNVLDAVALGLRHLGRL